MSNRALPREIELRLLGNWLKGSFREDIGLFDKQLFAYRELYEEAVKGDNSFYELFVKHKTGDVGLYEMERAVGGDAVAGPLVKILYLEARIEALNIQKENYIDQLRDPGADTQEITSKLLAIQTAIENEEATPHKTNLAASFLDQLDKEAAEIKMRFGKGFEALDRFTGGIRRGRLIVIAARPAAGKSAAALQIAYSVASKGNKVCYFPLEMTTQETLERLLLQQQIVDDQLAFKALRPEEREEVNSFLTELEEKEKFLIYEGVNKLEAIRQVVKNQRPDLIVLDQLTQIRPALQAKDIRERYTIVTSELKALAIEYNAAIILLTQLNRESTATKRPGIEHLHESDSTGQNADLVLELQRVDEEKHEGQRFKPVNIFITKNRQGESNRRIEQMFIGDRYTFIGKS